MLDLFFLLLLFTVNVGAEIGSLLNVEYIDRLVEMELQFERLQFRLTEQGAKLTEQEVKISEQSAKLTAQGAKITEQEAKITEQDTVIQKMQSKIDELLIRNTSSPQLQSVQPSSVRATIYTTIHTYIHTTIHTYNHTATTKPIHCMHTKRTHSYVMCILMMLKNQNRPRHTVLAD